MPRVCKYPVNPLFFVRIPHFEKFYVNESYLLHAIKYFKIIKTDLASNNVLSFRNFP